MYKVDTRAIKSAWEDYFGQFFDSGFALYPKDPSIGELLAPYICTETNEIRLGIPNLMRPHPAPFVTPQIFKRGPGTPETWTNCLFIEENLPRKLPHWPHDRWDDKNAKLPAEHPDVNYRSPHYADAEGYTATDENFGRPSPPEGGPPAWLNPARWPTSRGARCRRAIAASPGLPGRSG
ncbi:hypothetical protein [Nannocystis pusilla]|uniref:hypothetical protein n=1 Tax=Nannocystis pusilla TaxID=889268 RepID=UPI003B80D701